jgi:NDP-sugar pyrophosphorylase family protein
VAHDATVVGSVLGARSEVDRGAHVEHSVLLPGARVGPGARVSGSILGHDCVIGEECELTAVTVIGDNVDVPARARLADARVPAEGAS